jgi:hypothetical protein
MSISAIDPVELVSPEDMQPALALEASAANISRDLRVPLQPFEDGHGRGNVMLIRVSVGDTEAQVALIAYDEDPGFVHLFVGDRHLRGTPATTLRRIVAELHLGHFKAGWWNRPHDEKWPGNTRKLFP